MLSYDLENSVGFWIFATGHTLSCVLNEELQKLGITRRQWEVLNWISLAGDLSQTELAERMGIEAPTLVGVLDRMERDGWIQRVPSESDRRKKLIRATSQVEPVWAKMVECGLQIRKRATRGLDAEQLAALRMMLSTIRTNLQKDNPTEQSSQMTSDASA
jgi:MarR family transcriptional regulator for hemolysin